MKRTVKETLKGCIIATIGPSSENPETLQDMVDTGLGMARINLSHGTFEDAKRRFELIRDVEDGIPIMFDLSGPKIRIGKMKEPSNLAINDILTIQKQEIIGEDKRVSISYPELIEFANVGDKLYLNDGLIQVLIIDKNENELITKVITPGTLSSRKGVNTPGIPITLFPPTRKDLKDLEKTIDLEPDFYSVSFVRRRDDLVKVKAVISVHTNEVPPLISKIEHQDALKNFGEILKESDAIMVARGDLGVEIPPSTVPLVQKNLVKKSNEAAKPVIVATQMLESMVTSPRATRAEASDVANAILDGADSVMLSAETATGQYPVQAVKTMAEIIRGVQPVKHKDIKKKLHSNEELPTWEKVAKSAVFLADLIDATAIMVNTRTGNSARVISKYKPKQKILGVTFNKRVYRQMYINWGVIPIMIDKVFTDTDSMVSNSIFECLNQGYISAEDNIVVVAGSMFGLPHTTNLVQHYNIQNVINSERAKQKATKTYRIE